MTKLNDNVKYIKGVGERRAMILKKMGITTVDDLLAFYPRAYEHWENITPINEVIPGEKVCIKATCLYDVETRRTRNGLEMFTTMAGDGSGIVKIVIFGSKYTAQKLAVGEDYLFMGTVKHTVYGREMNSPKIQPFNGTGNISPIYPLTGGITASVLSNCMKNALAKYGEYIEENLPEGLTNAYCLISHKEAVKNIHFPENEYMLKKAKERLAFEELFFLQVGMFSVKSMRMNVNSPKVQTDYSSDFLKLLPFKMTNAQIRTLKECIGDIMSDRPMSRLIQGDVGSGKTAVAQAVMFTMAKNGKQCAMMAPTEILARQHYQTVCKTFENTDIKINLLVGSMSAGQKKSVKEQLKNGEVDIVIGTHTLIQKDVEFKALGLIITDEQHRFGVEQRAALAGKGENVNTLVMSATPIPRTLALILYGDLDVSVIDELPPGRQTVDTFKVDSSYSDRLYGFVRRQLESGRQGYIVCSMVNENEDEDILAATDYCKTVQEIFPEYKVGLLHGKMKGSEKEEVMRRFAAAEIQLLIATTVIEVGIDVPNATIMVVQNAERFGLSTLHQLRGRIGRGKHKSYCILVSDSNTKVSKERMEIMCSTCDGFKIATADLKQRGPGEFLGSRQHGALTFKVANMLEDTLILKQTQDAAKLITDADPYLKARKYAVIKREVKKMFENMDKNIFN